MRWKNYLPITLITLLVILSLSFLATIFLFKKANPPSEPNKPVSQGPPAAKSVGELIPFAKKELKGIKIYFQSYPTINPTTGWKENGIFWIEGEYIYSGGGEGSYLFKQQNPQYYDILRWPGNFSKPGGGRGDLLGSENRLRLLLSPDYKIKNAPEEYSVVRVKAELKERVKNPLYSEWEGKVSEIETIASFDTIKNGGVNVSEIQEALDIYVFEKYKGYLNLKTISRHFDGNNPDIFQKQECEQYSCINGIDLWFDKYWDPVNHRLLVKYDWSEDISNKKGCGFKYNVVRGVVSVNIQDQRVEAIYLDKNTAKMECPIINR